MPLLDLILQRTHAHAENLGCLAAVGREALKRLANQLRLYVGCGRSESHAKMARCLIADVGQMGRQMLR